MKILLNIKVSSTELSATPCLKHKKQLNVKVLLNCHKTKNITPQLFDVDKTTLITSCFATC